MPNLLLGRNWSFETVDEDEVPTDWISYGLDELHAYESPPTPYDGDRTCRPINPPPVEGVVVVAGLGQEDISVLQDTDVTLSFRHKLDGEPDEEILPPYPFLIVTITRTDTNAVLYESDPIYGGGAFNDWEEFSSGPVNVGAAVIGTSVPVAFKIELDPAGENVNGSATDYYHLDAVILDGTAGDGGGGEEEDPTVPPTGASGSGGFSVTSLELAVIRPLGTANIDTNPSFELTLTPWVAVGSTASISRVTANAFFDSYAMEIASSGGYGAAVRLYSLTVGAAYSWSVFVQGTKDDTARIRMEDATTEEGLSSFAFPVTGKPQRVWLPEVTIQSAGAPWAAGSRNIRVYIEVWGTTPTLYADGIQLELGPCTSYCDGEQEHCAWTGTAHASTSQRLWQTLYDNGVIHLGEIVPLLNYGSITGYNLSGFGMAPVEILKTPRGTGPGSFHQGIKYNERQMMISLHLDGEDPESDTIRTYEYEFALMELRQWLLDLIGPERVYGNAQFVLLAMTDPDPRKAKILQTTCVLSQGFGMEGVIVSYERVVAVIEAAYPFWRSINTQVVSASVLTPLLDANAILHRGADGEWDNVDTGLGPLGDNQVVNSLVYDADGNPIAAGAFQGAGSEALDVRCVAMFDGTDWNSLGLDSSNLGAETVFNKIVRDPVTGDLYAVGKNVVYEGEDLHCIIKYTADTATWGPVGQGLVADTAGDTEEIYDARIIGRIIYFAGTTTQIAALTGDPYTGAISSPYVAGWDMDDEEWIPFNPADGPNLILNSDFEDYDFTHDLQSTRDNFSNGGVTAEWATGPLTPPSGTRYVKTTGAGGWWWGIKYSASLWPNNIYRFGMKMHSQVGYSPQLFCNMEFGDFGALANQSFEDDAVGATTATGWTLNGCTVEVMSGALEYLVAGPMWSIDGGSQHLKITPTSSPYAGISQDVILTVNTPVRLAISIKTDAFVGADRLYRLIAYSVDSNGAEVYRNQTSIVITAAQSGSVQRVDVAFNALSEAHRIYIQKDGHTGTDPFYVDAVRLSRPHNGGATLFAKPFPADNTWQDVSVTFNSGLPQGKDFKIPVEIGYIHDPTKGSHVVSVDDWYLHEPGGPLTPWEDTGMLGLNGYAASLAEDVNGNLAIGGYFQYAGAVEANGVAIWDVTRRAWRNLGFDITYDDITHIEATLICQDIARRLVVSGRAYSTDPAKSRDTLAHYAPPYTDGTTTAIQVGWAEYLFRPNTGIEHRRKVGDTHHLFGPFTQIGSIYTTVGRRGVRDGYVAWNGANTWGLLDIDIPGIAKDLLDDGADMYVGFDGAGTAYTPGSTSITNVGTNPAFPVITITRTGGTFLKINKITNETIGAVLEFDYEFEPDEALTIDTRPDSKGITSSLYGPRNGALLSSPANLAAFAKFHLAKGLNVFTTDMMGDGDNADIRIRYTGEHLSIDGIVRE
jgi:hypothetical protein